MKDEFFPQIKKYSKAILNKYPVKIAYLYGSFATGSETEKSDVDIALFSEKR